jgi:acyl-coenzyme A synthetase/AMP-(fatty) acid ligase
VTDREIEPSLLGQLFVRIVENCPLDTAVLDEVGDLTYEELHRLASRLVRGFVGAGMRRGDRVVVRGAYGRSAVITLVALWLVGAVLFFFPDERTVTEEFQLIESAEPEWELDGSGQISRRHERRPSALVSAEFSSKVRHLFVTSGTSASPKLVAHSDQSLISGLLSTVALQAENISGVKARCATDGGLETADAVVNRLLAAKMQLRYLSVMPPSTIAWYTVVQRALLTGESVATLSDATPGQIMASVDHHRISNAALSPFVALRLLRVAKRIGWRGNSLLMVGIGGNRVPPVLLADLEDHLGCVVLPGYGTTETGGPVLMPRIADVMQDRRESVGKPLPGVTVTFARIDASLGMNESNVGLGELEVRCNSLMLGYWRTVDNRFGQLKFRTGDLARHNNSGSVSIVGRVDGAIVRGGAYVDAVRIETRLEEFPGVDRAAVVGRPSRVPGEDDIVAYVTLRHDSPFDERDLLRWCRRSLGLGESPRRIYRRESFPMTADGAIRKFALVSDIVTGMRNEWR